LKSGRLIDKLLYREKFMIRCYEVGTNRTASMETMANLLQVML
jgi:fatty acyl-ACP thioesterase A